MMIDISAKITNQLPVIKITDEIIVTVNNRKNTILNLQAMVQEAERKAEKEGGTYDEMAYIAKAMEMLIGKKSSEEIEKLDLPLPEYKEIYSVVMQVATGTYGQETPTE